jgi:N-acyl homoserine lactone hydrolase
MAAGGC